MAEQRRREDRIKYAERAQSLPVFSSSPASQSLKSRTIALLHYQQHFGAMGKLHVRNSQAETKNGMRDLFATQLTYICHLWVEQIIKKVWRSH